LSLSISTYNPDLILASNEDKITLSESNQSDPVIKINTGGEKFIYADFKHDQTDIIAINRDCDMNYMNLYDIRNYSKTKCSINFNIDRNIQWTSVIPSKNNEFALITTNDSMLMLYEINEDNFGNDFGTLNGCENEWKQHRGAAILPDCKYVVCGNSGGIIDFWEVSSGIKVAKLEKIRSKNNTSRRGPAIHQITFNHEHKMFTSLSNEFLTFWIEKI
jgi:hypothetical protein